MAAALQRDCNGQTSGKRESDVASYIDSAVEVTAQPTVVEAIFRETEGNPLFVGEIVRLLAEEGLLDRRPDASWRLSIPQGVRKVIGRRLQLLPPECTEALVLASFRLRQMLSTRSEPRKAGDARAALTSA